MSFSTYIIRLTNLLELLGVSVFLHVHNLPVSGQTDYQKRTICLNESNAKLALMALAHEGGHWLSYLLWNSVELDFNRKQREILAFHLGWWFLVGVGCTGKTRMQVSVSDWYGLHPELFGKLHGVVCVPYEDCLRFEIIKYH